MIRTVRSLMLEGTSEVPYTNLLLEAGLVLSLSHLLRALSGKPTRVRDSAACLGILSPPWLIFPVVFSMVVFFFFSPLYQEGTASVSRNGYSFPALL